MKSRSPLPSQRWWISPWMIVGMVCILGTILVVLAIRNVHREQAFMERALLSEANVLINSIEASSRSGAMGMHGWGQQQMQLLLEETAHQPDVLYAALVAGNGEVIADSAPERVGRILPFKPPQEGEVLHRFSEQSGVKSFDVIRAFSPWFRCGSGKRGRQCGEGLYLVVGLDPAPFEEAIRQDLHQTIFLFAVMFLVGAAGFISLIWAHHFRLAKRSLRDVEAFTATIVNQMPVGLIATDRDGRIQQINAAARAILRSSGNSLETLQDLPSLIPVVRQLENEEAVLEEEIECGIVGDACLPLLVNASVIRDAEDQVTGYVFLFTDMTNIKRLEEDLRRSERLASLGRLAAGVAHEIRNPLSSIKGFATILEGRCRSDPQSSEMASVMKKEVERLNRVVTELLDFARPMEIHKQRFACRQILEHTVQLIKTDAEHHGIAIAWEVDPDDLEIHADRDKFSQVLLNLFLNALQSMEAGGVLVTKVRRESEEVIFQVQDTGEGIPPEHLPHIFDPYFTTKARGVGLGLANAHKIVEAHGGGISVSSTPGKGSTFTIRIPA